MFIVFFFSPSCFIVTKLKHARCNCTRYNSIPSTGQSLEMSRFFNLRSLVSPNSRDRPSFPFFYIFGQGNSKLRVYASSCSNTPAGLFHANAKKAVPHVTDSTVAVCLERMPLPPPFPPFACDQRTVPGRHGLRVRWSNERHAAAGGGGRSSDGYGGGRRGRGCGGGGGRSRREGGKSCQS